MKKIGDRAVVLGASIAGLLAARVLSEAYPEVLLVERDRLTGGARRGVPQASHVHALLPSGLAVLNTLFPGLTEEFTRAGVPAGWAASDGFFCFRGQRLSRAARAGEFLMPSRPFLEDELRQRVLSIPGVSLRDQVDVVGLAVDGGRVTGARVIAREPGSAEAVIPADLVVDATGRGGRTPVWLAEQGYPKPAEEQLKSRVSYASRRLRLAPGALDGELAVLIGAYPGHPRGMALFAQEGEAWQLSVSGLAGHRPPTDPAKFLAYVATVAPPHVFAAIREAEPLGEITTCQFPHQQRRRYEKLRRFPAGLLVIGDALCSFNPLYGQGMSVAAMEAAALRDCLRRGSHNLARRFFRAAARVLQPAWQAAVSADLSLPEIQGVRPLPVRLGNAWVARVQQAGVHDPVAATAFLRVSALLAPPSALLRPGLIARVVRHRWRHGPPRLPAPGALANAELS